METIIVPNLIELWGLNYSLYKSLEQCLAPSKGYIIINHYYCISFMLISLPGFIGFVDPPSLLLRFPTHLLWTHTICHLLFPNNTTLFYPSRLQQVSVLNYK